MKIMIFALSILFALFSVSCADNDQKKYNIGVSQCSDDLWRTTMNDEMKREAGFYTDVSLKIKTVKDDTGQQIKDIESFIDEGVDILIISPNESASITPVVQKAFKAGIPVILVDRKIDTEDYTAYIGADNYAIGKELAIYVAQVLNGEGNVVEVRGREGSTSDKERHDGFSEIIRLYPDIHVVAQPRGNFLQDVAQKEMSDLLARQVKIDLVYAMNDPMAMGVSKALDKYNDKRPFIVGIDALPGKDGGIQNIMDGHIDASFIYPTGGDKAIDLAMRILKGQAFNRDNILYTAAVDKSNARILQLQYEQIKEHQMKLERMNTILDKSMAQYANQQMLFYAAVLCIILITALLVALYIAYRTKSTANTALARQNDEIKRQTVILEEQKEQLVSLSKQLEDATQAKLVFFTNISHEFRTPLTLIMGPVESLLKSKNVSDDERDMLKLIKRNSERLLALMTQIIEFRSYENGKMRTFFTRDDMKAFLDDLNTAFTDLAARKQVRFHFECSRKSILMSFDKEKMEKIYFNLLSNAFKFTERGGAVKVSLTTLQVNSVDSMCLTVFNSGKGIPQDKIDNIFDRFYKVDPHDSGTGVGLALTSALVDVHGGTIRAESDNKGTTFILTLPLHQPDSEESIDMDNSYQSGSATGILSLDEKMNKPEEHLLEDDDPESNKPIILVIEDNQDVRNFMYLILKDEYTVLEAEDGDTGVLKAVKHVPDVIISDVMMPGKNGFEVCAEVKENASTSHIPVILLTACALDEQKAIGFESGADAYIPKPFDARLLKIRVRKLIENRQKLREAFGSSLKGGDPDKTSLVTADQNFVTNFRNYVTENITDSEMNVDEIARKMGFSRVQLYRKLKSLTGYSPIELIKITRLKYAMNLLRSSQSISEVAYQSGFTSPSYFSKCFKDFYHENPSDYLKV